MSDGDSILGIQCWEYDDKSFVLSPGQIFERSVSSEFYAVIVNPINSDFIQYSVEIVNGRTNISTYCVVENTVFRRNFRFDTSVVNPILRIRNLNDTVDVNIRLVDLITNVPENSIIITHKRFSVKERELIYFFENVSSVDMNFVLGKKELNVQIIESKTDRPIWYDSSITKNFSKVTSLRSLKNYELLLHSSEEVEFYMKLEISLKFPVISFVEFAIDLPPNNKTIWILEEFSDLLYVALDENPKVEYSVLDDEKIVLTYKKEYRNRIKFGHFNGTKYLQVKSIDSKGQTVRGRFVTTNYYEFYVYTNVKTEIRKKDEKKFVLFNDIYNVHWRYESFANSEFEIYREELPTNGDVAKVKGFNESGITRLYPYYNYDISVKNLDNHETPFNLFLYMEIKAFSSEDKQWKTIYSLIIAFSTTACALFVVILLSLLICVFSPKVNCLGITGIRGKKRKTPSDYMEIQ